MANATLELPDLLIDREQEVMLDELRVRLAEQGIGFEDYLRVTERDESQMIGEYRPDAERRVKRCSFSPRSPRTKTSKSREELAAELAARASATPCNPRLVTYLESPRARRTRDRCCAGRRLSSAHRSLDRAHPEFEHVHICTTTSAITPDTTTRATSMTTVTPSTGNH